MAEDLRLYLADRPVLARRSTPAEQLVRWCRQPRCRGALLTVAATLLLALLYHPILRHRHRAKRRTPYRSRDEAEHQRQRAELVNQFFMDEVFGQADPNVFKRAGISLVQALDTAAGNIDTKFPDDPELRAMLQTRLGRIYSAMDEQPKAIKQLQSAVVLWERVAGKLDPKTLSARGDLGSAMSKSGHGRKRKPSSRQRWPIKPNPWSRSFGYIAYRDPLRRIA